MERQLLLDKYGDPGQHITNGSVVQIYKDAMKEGLGANLPAEWIKVWADKPYVSTHTLRVKILRTVSKASKLRRAAHAHFIADTFMFPAPVPEFVPTSIFESQPSTSTQAPIPIVEPQLSPSTSSTILTPAITMFPGTIDQQPLPSPELALPSHASTKSPVKRQNFAKFCQLQEQKKLLAIEKKIENAKNELSLIRRKRGHYNEKNVKKREGRNALMRTALRTEKNEYKERARKQMAEIARLREEVNGLKQEMNGMKVTISNLEENLLREQKELQEIKVKKRKAEKRASFHMKQKLEAMKRLKELEESLGMEDEDRVTMEGGKYKDNIRLCVLELTALEVATGKIGEVINCIAENIFKTKFDHLPSRQACQNIVDEGQYLAKAVIGEKLKESKGWGLHKDGTTRKTVKILDTSVTTSEGASFSLGFSSVVSETAEAISEDVKEKVNEIDAAVGEEGFMNDLMRKLIYFMNDRAANEKKSSRLLEEWREEMLAEVDGGQVHTIHHLFCTAHVLLGFQSYTLKALHALNITGQLKHPITTLLRDAADLFGPVGDYRGFRNVWEAYCQDRGKKSIIQNFKDNRFNGLFEVSAQVYYHHQEFISLLQTKSSNNAKQTKLLKALQNEDLMLAVECLGMFFFKITGPFWSLAISPTVCPSDLPAIIQKLRKSLDKTKISPDSFFEESSFDFLDSFRPRLYEEAKLKLDWRIKSPRMAEVISNISSGFLDTLTAQMSDFLAAGKYRSQSAAKALRNASFTPVNNLACERNFGMLDASQRRRPSASLHHHSSVIALKQNKGLIKQYCARMSASRRKVLWAKATTMGKALRRKHRAQDKQVSIGSWQRVVGAEKHSKKRVISPASAASPPSAVPNVNQGDMVAIACEDRWYPAIVLDDSGPGMEITVDFAELGKGLGSFKWPNGHDVHKVSRKSVLEAGLDIQARGGGRSWMVVNARDIQKKFEK